MCASPSGLRNGTETTAGTVASPRCSARNASRTTARAFSGFASSRISRSDSTSTVSVVPATEGQHAVVATEPEGIRDRDVDLLGTGRVREIVEVAVGIGDLLVEG